MFYIGRLITNQHVVFVLNSSSTYSTFICLSFIYLFRYLYIVVCQPLKTQIGRLSGLFLY